MYAPPTVMGYRYNDNAQSLLSHTATYTYDGVNRLATATARSLSGSVLWSYTCSYDRWGNMTCVQNGSTNGPCPQWAYNASTNRLTTSGFTYDAAGNLTQDSSNPTTHTYQWDAEGRVASVDNGSTWAFTYNALGGRVQWGYSGGVEQHLFDPNGGWLGVAGSYTLIRWGDVYWGVYSSSETYFNHVNHLGSTMVMTNHAGTGVGDLLFYPWGDVWQQWGTGGAGFAELPYDDTKTNTNLTAFRLQSPNLGRWLSPDPLAGEITNPQSLNRYAYVLNNPTSLTDPLGLDACNGIATVGCIGEEASQSNHGGGGGGTDPNNNCSLTNTVDASCAGPPGLWENGEPIYGSSLGGNWGGIGGVGSGFGSGPLSGDFGPFGYPSAGGWGPPCEFGTCSEPPPNGYVSTAQPVPPEERQWGELFKFYVGVDEWLDPLAHLDPGLRGLFNGGNLASPIASPWAPLVWYGGSAATAIGASYVYPLWLASGGIPGIYNCLASASLGATHAVNGWAPPGGWSWPIGACGKIGWGLGWVFGD